MIFLFNEKLNHVSIQLRNGLCLQKSPLLHDARKRENCAGKSIEQAEQRSRKFNKPKNCLLLYLVEKKKN